MSIYSDSSGEPGTSLHVLTNPESFATGTNIVDFTSDGSFTLTAGTTYWVVVERASDPSIILRGTNSTNQRGEPGWTIGDTAFLVSSGTATQV